MAVLAKTQNACLTEMGYYPTLLKEHIELKKQFTLLRNDNQRLYSDNYKLAQYVQAQDQRLKQAEQQKRPQEDIEERVRKITAERDEVTGRLHSAYVFFVFFCHRRCENREMGGCRLNEVMLLRQELSRFVPTAVMVPARERLPPGYHQQQQQQVAHHRVAPMPAPQHMGQQHPSTFIQYTGPSSTQQTHRHTQPLPAHRQSHPTLSPIDTSTPPTIAGHHRTSAPVVMTAPPNGAGPGPGSVSPSPLSHFNTLTIMSPATSGGSGRPSTAGAPSNAPPVYIPRPSTGPPRSVPPQIQQASSSSLTGAASVIDLTEDESKVQDSARKRRKTEHSLDIASPPARQLAAYSALPITPVSPPFAPPAGEHISQNTRALPQRPPPPPVQPSNPPPAAAPQQPSVVSQPANNPSLPDPPANEDVSMDEQSTLEEDCLDANFDEDEDDPNKLWCKMCRSRFKVGHTSEVPQPFVGISPGELVAHCASVHPQGWEVLQQRIAVLRAQEERAA
ncbi:hypothetical protein BC628DRAFT_333245 [Trametes gibbosa]|nr:hypothetical protein BC628DRAFT_333245 [Trametes gibbosa]